MIRALLLLLFATPLARAGFINVPWDAPTIQAAVDLAVPGDQIHVEPGVYRENVVIDGKSDLTIIGEGNAILDVGDGGFALRATNVTRLKLVNIRVRAGAMSSGILIYGGKRVTLKRCSVFDCGNTAIGVQGDDILVDRCSVKGGIELTSTGISLHATNSTVRRCRITRCYGGIDVDGSDNVIEENTLKEIDGDAIAVGFPWSVDAGRNRVARNVIRCSTTGIDVDHAVATVIEDNVVAEVEWSGIRLRDDAPEGGVWNNLVTRTGFFHGIEVGADSAFVLMNRVARSEGHGILVSGSTGHQVFFNRVRRSGIDGFRVNATASTFVGNSAHCSEWWDLCDVSGGTTNTYVNNSFPWSNL